jgi:hypothetical protein
MDFNQHFPTDLHLPNICDDNTSNGITQVFSFLFSKTQEADYQQQLVHTPKKPQSHET